MGLTGAPLLVFTRVFVLVREGHKVAREREREISLFLSNARARAREHARKHTYTRARASEADASREDEDDGMGNVSVIDTCFLRAALDNLKTYPAKEPSLCRGDVAAKGDTSGEIHSTGRTKPPYYRRTRG